MTWTGGIDHIGRVRTSAWPERYSRAGRFASVVAERYLRRERHRRRLDLPVVWSPGAYTTLAHRHLHVARTIVLRLAVAIDRRMHVYHPPLVASIPGGGQRDAVSSAARVSMPFVDRAERMSIVQRMIARVIRTEVAPGRSTGRGPLTLAGRIPDEPAQVQRRSAAAGLPLARPRLTPPPVADARDERRPDTAASMAPAADDRFTRPVTRRTSADAALDDSDLRRITARVISSIDDRIIAVGERLGRV